MNYRSHDLAALDASIPHPGLDPFRKSKLRRELAGLPLSFGERIAAALALEGIATSVPLPSEAQRLIAEILS